MTRQVEHVYTATAQLMEGRQITINGNFYDDDSLADKHKRLDETMAVLERQRKAFEIPILQKNMEQAMKSLQTNMDQLESLSNELLRRKDKAPAQLKMNIQNYRANIEKIKKDIEEGNRAIAELEAEVAEALKAA